MPIRDAERASAPGDQRSTGSALDWAPAPVVLVTAGTVPHAAPSLGSRGVTKWYLPHELPTADLLVMLGDSVSARPTSELVNDVAAALAGSARFAPTRASTHEPVQAFTGSLQDRLAAFVTPGAERYWLLFGRDEPALDGTLTIHAELPLDRAARTHVVDAGIPLQELDAEAEDAFADWAIDIFEALGVFHGYVTTADMEAQRKDLISDATRRGVMAPPRFHDPLYTVLDRMVSDVYWVNYFGPAFVDRLGSTALRAPGVRHRTLPSGAIAVWATESPPAVEPAIGRLTDYDFKRSFYDALGSRTFTRESLDLPEPGEVVPTLHDHRRRTAR
jgi:hypothetical protein